jgi:hypothetical protein
MPCLAGFTGQVACRVGELGEDEHLVFAVRLREQLVQRLPLVVLVGLPGTLAAEQLVQDLGVVRQVFGQLGLEQSGPNPLEALLVFALILLVDRLGAGHVVGQAVFLGHRVDQTVQQVFGVALQAFGVFVHPLQVEQSSVQHTHRQVEPVINGVQVDLVAQNVPVDRLQEREAVGLQPLEQVGAAETHEPLARFAQVLDQFALGRCGLLFFLRVDVQAQAVAGHMQR